MLLRVFLHHLCSARLETMNDLFQQFGAMGGDVLWGVAGWRLGVAFLIIFVGFASRKVIGTLFGIFGRRAKGTQVKWDDEATRLLAKPLAVIVQILLWKVAAIILLLPIEPVNTRLIVAQGLDIALMIGVIWVFFRVVDVLASVAERMADTTQTRIDDQAVPLLRKTLKVFLAVLGGIFVVQNMGFSVLSVVTGLGIGGLALALAAQDSVANFFGSLILFTDAPFQVEDYVEVNGVSGTVEEVGFRTTRIRQDDSSIVCVPNQTFTGSFITNLSERKGRLIAFDLGISLPATATDLKRFVEDVQTAFAALVNVRESSVEVHLSDFKESHVVVRARAFTVSTKWNLFLETRQDLMFGCLELLESAGLSLVHPPNRLVLDTSGNGSSNGLPTLEASPDARD